MDLSLIIPCYNETPILVESVRELVAVLRATRLTYELIFVDDASRDGTVELLERCRRQYADIPMRIIRHETNTGRGRTVTDGWRAAQGRIVGYLDIDLEVHARYIPAMVDAIDRQGVDGAIAWRIYKVMWSVLLRAVCSKAYHVLVHGVLRLPFKDTETGFKFFKREAVLPLLDAVQDPGWFWDTELMARAWFQGLRIAEIPCLFIRRTDKRSSVRVFRDSWRYLVALMRFKRQWLRCPSQTSLLYRRPWLYHWAMRLLHARRERRRFEAIAAHIPAGVSVVDVCSADCALYRYYLQDKGIDHLGVDLNPRLLYRGGRAGSRVRLMDVRREELPQAEVVVMQASLYQFIPDHHAMMQRLLRAARQRVIIAEPINNWSSSSSGWRRRLSQRWTNPGTGPVPHRFGRADLEQLFRQYGARLIQEHARGRELIGVFDLHDGNLEPADAVAEDDRVAV
ncbi:MAG: hypothetical protein COV75_07580 [Candidatus Omnitrophica bacterium CG11_big_fil_rev_8_21_14_0_20_63_9]|nr:MAG: hypothetical protein COV75_07580 [Candidatus Omnitrophica bacterium CG11_big_fil_rev_8_21_14_0_20_63_9]